MNLLKQHEWAEAEAPLRDCLKIREAEIPDDWLRFNTVSQLGGSLLGQGRYTEAEPLILSGYEGMKAREAKIPAPAKLRLTEAGNRVVQLYEALGKAEKVREWRTKIEHQGEDLPPDVFAGLSGPSQ
jgi:hypothetical protein